jgi:hypothetical protein
VDTLARLTEELETTTTTLERVRRLIFGPRSETTETALGTDATAPPGADPNGQGEVVAATKGEAQGKKPRQGHGRNGAQAYPRAGVSPDLPSGSA